MGEIPKGPNAIQAVCDDTRIQDDEFCFTKGTMKSVLSELTRLRAELEAVRGKVTESDREIIDSPPCRGCGGPHRFDTSVDSDVWNRVIRGGGLADYLCLDCIVIAFAEAGESLEASLYGDSFDGVGITMTIAEKLAAGKCQHHEVQPGTHTEVRSDCVSTVSDFRLDPQPPSPNEAAAGVSLHVAASVAPIQKRLDEAVGLLRGVATAVDVIDEEQPGPIWKAVEDVRAFLTSTTEGQDGK